MGVLSKAKPNRLRDKSDNRPVCTTIGAILRIADAIEKMSGSYAEIIQQRDRYKQWYEARGLAIERLHRSNAALRGVIAKMKKARRK